MMILTSCNLLAHSFVLVFPPAYRFILFQYLSPTKTSSSIDLIQLPIFT